MLKKLISRLRKRKVSKEQAKNVPTEDFSGNIKKDEALLRETFRDCGDVKYRKLNIPAMGNRQAVVTFVEGLVNVDALHRDIISPLLTPRQQGVKAVTELVAAGEVQYYSSPSEIAGQVLLGKVAVVVQGDPRIYIIESKDWPMRGIEEPLQEKLIRGSREGFTEIIQVNLGMVRRRLPDPNLKVIMMEVGRRSKTKVAILYVKDVCDLDTAKEIEKRIEAIDIDGIIDPGVLSELITERTFSPFPLILSTERPDKVLGGILQGKVAIIADGSPFAMLAPVCAVDFFHVPEDYYMHPLFALISRLFRFVGIILGTTLVGAFVAMVTYHYEVIPANIVTFIAETREGVPFAPLAEAFLLEFTVEVLREASVRLPGPVGSTLGIVGALILGQAAVSAHLVSPVLLIIVALSFIAGSIIPNYEAALVTRWIRFPILLAAGVL